MTCIERGRSAVRRIVICGVRRGCRAASIERRGRAVTCRKGSSGAARS